MAKILDFKRHKKKTVNNNDMSKMSPYDKTMYIVNSKLNYAEYVDYIAKKYNCTPSHKFAEPYKCWVMNLIRDGYL